MEPGRCRIGFSRRVVSWVAQRTLEASQRLGFNITLSYFYSPIPNLAALKANRQVWQEETQLVGLDKNVPGQLHMLQDVFPKFAGEYNFPLHQTPTPYEYYVDNEQFGFVSAAALHAMIRHLTPRTMIEVGSGFSTFVAARAGLMNAADGKPVTLFSIDPNPNRVLRNGFPGLSEQIPKKVQDVDLDFFAQLGDGDILFIDSSHVLRIGGDVTFLYLEVLPRLKKGVVVHVHDIFFPRQYPRDWVLEKQHFWTEQYLLQAFLAFNDRFEVLWCGSYVSEKFPQELRQAFPPPAGLGVVDKYFSSSLWMRRVA